VVGCQHHAPAALPPRKTRYPLYRRLGEPQVLSGRVRKISPPPGFDPRTVQPVASRYTDWATLRGEVTAGLVTCIESILLYPIDGGCTSVRNVTICLRNMTSHPRKNLRHISRPENLQCYIVIVKVKNQLNATKYAVLLPQHVSGTNMPIIRSTINK
jgi:hypothetical protein